MKQIMTLTLTAGLMAAVALTGLADDKEIKKQKTQQAKVEYKVDGLSCSACEKHLTKELTKLDSVKVDKVCSKSGAACLTFDASKVKKDQIYAAILKSGYKVKGELLTLNVKGMSCGACSKKVNTALTSLKGVKVDQVCHKSDHAVLTFDPKKVSEKQIIAAIDKTGFKVDQKPEAKVN